MKTSELQLHANAGNGDSRFTRDGKAIFDMTLTANCFASFFFFF